MSDPVTALANAVLDGPVRVEETGPHGMITLRGDLSDAAITGAVSKAFGLDMPATRRVTASGDRMVAWMTPDEALLMLPHSEVAAVMTALTEALGAAHALVADMSDARAVFRISGEDSAVRETLARLAPVDMDRFEFGEIRRTRLAQIPAAFWMGQAGQVDLVCFRSVARYAFDLLGTSAQSPRVRSAG